jgi:NADH-quinone oxidoreductase subunit K
MIPLNYYLLLAAIVFSLGLLGLVINRKNILILLMCVELLLLAVNINFIAFSHYFNDLAGQIVVFFILAVAAVEAAIGLAILIVLFRTRHSIEVDALNRLQG